MPDKYLRLRLAYAFLRGQSGSVVTTGDLADAAGWAESTARTYATKSLHRWLARVGPGMYQVKGMTGVSEAEFLQQLSQGKPAPGDSSDLATAAREAIARGEGPRVEFKAAMPKQASNLAQKFASFATDGGGAVYLGIENDGRVAGLGSEGENQADYRERLEVIARSVNPAIGVEVAFFELDALTVCRVLVPNGPQPIYYVNGRPYVRVGSESRLARPDEVATRFDASRPSELLERHRPTFARIPGGGLNRAEASFEPKWKFEHVSGDTPANVEWRFRGPRFRGMRNDWRQVPTTALPRHTVAGKFDLSRDLEPDDRVGSNELGLELRFVWLSINRHELHRWTLTRPSVPGKVLWDVGDELPIEQWDGD